MTTKVVEKKACRACGAKFTNKILWNFGNQAIIDFPDEGEEDRGRAPIQLVQCPACDLIQLRHTVDADTLYSKFFYRSSVNEQMREALRDVVNSATNLVDLSHTAFICDIGTNDGELLLNYPEDVWKIGFEPAEDFAREAAGRFRARKDEKFEIVPSYFNAVEALACSQMKLYKVISACAVFYDLDNPTEFLYDIKSILAPDGIFVVQMNYLALMIKNLTFDNVEHEHLCYYSLTTLKNLFDKVGLDIFDVELNDVNGGSIRVYACHKNARPIGHNVIELLMQEANQPPDIKHFGERAIATSNILLNFLKELKKNDMKVYAYGASTRGSMMLQTIFREEKATDYLIAAAERDERKYGKRMAGLDLPIIPEAEAREKADYMLVLPYAFWRSIQQREKEWMSKGGKFILPLPYPKVVHLESMGLVARDLDAVLEAIRV